MKAKTFISQSGKSLRVNLAILCCLLVKIFSACLLLPVNSSFIICYLSRFRDASAYWQQMLNRRKNFHNLIHWATCSWNTARNEWVAIVWGNLPHKEKGKNVLYWTPLFSEAHVCKAQVRKYQCSSLEWNMSPMTLRAIRSLTAISTILLHLPKITAEFKIPVFIWTFYTFKLTTTISIISEINYVLHFKLVELL